MNKLKNISLGNNNGITQEVCETKGLNMEQKMRNYDKRTKKNLLSGC